MFGKRNRGGVVESCIPRGVIKYLINHMERVSPGIVFMLEQYYRYNYSGDRSLWHDVLASDPGEFIRVVMDYYDIRMEYGEFIVYEILRIILHNDVLKVGAVMDLVRENRYSDINKIICGR